MTDRRITLEVSEEHGGIQLSINETDKNGSGSGYRLFGPKFSGGSTLLRSHTLDARDVAEIRRYLDRFDELSAAGAEGDNHD